MEDEIKNIFKEQLAKLPKDVVTFLSSTNWDADLDEIGSLYNLSREGLVAFRREIILVLVGLVHPDEFKEVLEQEVGARGATLEALIANVEKKVFAPIRPALIEFFEKEASESESRKSKVESDAQTPDLAPDNLPTEETAESFLPKLTPKIIMPSPANQEQEAVHPFEEKMKEVFTAGQNPIDTVAPEVAPEPVAPTAYVTPGIITPQKYVTPAPTASPSAHGDPYREAIE